MRRSSRCLVALCSLCTFSAISPGQTAQASPQSAPPGSQSSETKPHQEQQQAQSSDKAANPAAIKRVWTNEDVGNLRDHSPISTVGNANRRPAKHEPNQPQHTASLQTTKWYHDEILQLEKKIPPLDAQIRDLQAGLNGEQVNSVRRYGWDRADDWRDQLARLQKQRQDILAKISVVEDEARHKGVPENALR